MNHTLARNIAGCILILVAVAIIVYDFFSPPVGELSNFALILFAKLMAIAGALMNIDFKAVIKNFTRHDTEE